MRRKGCSIIFFNDHRQVLLFLRDDIAGIPYPNMWDIPGGHVEQDETPEHCIVREMKEEMGLDLIDFNKFKVVDFVDRMEYVFWKKENLNINNIRLTEGQCLKWFSEEEIKKIHLAYSFDEVAHDFFNTKL